MHSLQRPEHDRVTPAIAPSGNAEGRPRRTAAGRLIEELTRDSAVELSTLAHGLGVEEASLERCRGGHALLPHVLQMRLAALALLLAPQHERRARTLFAQAQAALRLEQGVVEGHLTYPREHLR